MIVFFGTTQVVVFRGAKKVAAPDFIGLFKYFCDATEIIDIDITVIKQMDHDDPTRFGVDFIDITEYVEPML